MRLTNSLAARATFCILGAALPAWADTHTTAVPQLTSRSGGAYTVYLDFAGFNFTGTWGGSGKSPGVIPSYNGESPTGAFTATEQGYIKNVWARVAEAYAPFNINVTTVDPAVGVGKADTDAHRQAYYDATARMMHTIIGGNDSWYGSAGGVSYVGVDKNTQSTTPNGGASAGYHTDYIFSEEGQTNFQFLAVAAAHENGHGFGLSHQADYLAGALKADYSSNNTARGNGSFAPIMGEAYSVQRATWRQGTSDQSAAIQNDPLVITSNPGMGGFVSDGIGHTFATATPITLTGSAVNFNAAKGVVVPVSSLAPNPSGATNYTVDYFSFRSTGGTVTLKANDGGELITPGTADPQATLESNLTIFNQSGAAVGSGTLATNTLSETFTGVLPAGIYYAQVASNGGYTAPANTTEFDSPSNYYSMGSFFLTGSGLVPVPEPTSVVTLAMVGVWVLGARRREGNKRQSD